MRRWSTDEVVPARALDRYAEALATALDPMQVASPAPDAFHAEVTAAPAGPLTIVRAVGDAHRCVRCDTDIAQSGGRSLNLIVNTKSPWSLVHLGAHRLRAGDAVLVDSQRPHEIELGEFDITHLKLPADWLDDRVPSIDALAGRVLPFDSNWARALTSFAVLLTPDSVARLPLSGPPIADRIGALLARIANEIGAAPQPMPQRALQLRSRVIDVLTERCAEPSLAAADVSRVLGVSTRTLHRALAASGAGFGELLLAARVRIALRMLESPRFDHLTAAEIGRRAGFADASHFTRVLQRRCGLTPRRIRRERDAF